MEFYPQDAASAADAAACAALFADHTVLLPAVSQANLGQLTLDLVVNTLLQNGEAFDVQLTRVGHLLSEAAPPIAGGAAFATQQPQSLCLNLEVYQSKEKKITIVQQRAPVLPGRACAFAKELVEWALTSKVAALGVVAGCDDMLRHDPNMMSRPIRTIYSADAAQLDEAFLARFEGLTTNAAEAKEEVEQPSSSADQWASIRGAGLAPLLHAQCDEQKLPFIAWAMPCSEGNNVPDAAAMATQLFRSLRIAPKHSTANPAAASNPMPPMLPFAFPPSWNQLFGRGPDVSLSKNNFGGFQSSNMVSEPGADMVDSSRRGSGAGEPRLEFVPARIPKLVAASPAPVISPSKAAQDLQADILELARALENVNLQRQKLLSKSASQPSVRLEPLCSSDYRQARHKSTPANNCCDSFTDLILSDCGEEMRPADERFHLQHECRLRLIRCVRPGCTKLFQASNRELHEQRDCQFTRHTRQLLRDRDDGDTPVECELCHETRFIIRKRHLQSHQLYMCVKRRVPCRFAEWGCETKFPQEEQEAHEASQCVVAERRRQIAADALLVNEEIVCDWCQQKVKKRKLLDHQEDECPERERPCPNAVNGCKEWVPVGKFDEHLRTDCIVTIERNTLAARAREKNSPVTCPECGVVVRLRHLERHFRDDCVSRIVSCKNAAHGCKARLRWRDRHLHEDFMSLSKDRSMIEFKTGGNAYIAINNSTSQAPSSHSSVDLPPPWTAEYFVWMVDAEEEILSLHRSSLELMETVVLNTRENEQWQAKSDACKKKLKELKQKRKRKANDKAQAAGTHLSGEEMSSAAKQLAEDFNDAENGLLATRKEIALARGWIEINILEAKRILDADVADEEAKQALAASIADQTAQILQERTLLGQLLPEADRVVLDDLEAWATQLASGSPSKESKAERQRKAAEQNKLLKKRSEFQAQLEALDPDDADTPRLQRRFEREIAKVDAKLALVSENKPTQLLERCGRHIIASSAKNVISLVAGPKGEISFYRPSGAKAAREVNFQARLERNRWNHVVFSAGAKELSLFVNGELKSVRRGVFDLPMSRIGFKEQAESFQGFVLEVRYWKECRTVQQIQQHAASILHVRKCKTLLGYWTFEEGMGDLVDDMALKLPRSACFGTSWVLFDTPEVRKRFGLPPTPSLRDQTCCVVNQKLKLLAQRARDRELDMVPCRQHCEQVVAFRGLERHHRVECVHRMVVCKEVGCEQVYRWSSEAEHLRAKCERHLFREELVRRYHDKRELVECILNCAQLVQRRFLALHCHKECANRLITCPWADCGETIVAKTLARHLERDCRSQSKEKDRVMVENARRRQKARAAGDGSNGEDGGEEQWS